MMIDRVSLLVVAVASAAGCTDGLPRPDASTAAASARSLAARPPVLTPQQSGTTNRLQAISPVSARVAWASGVGGTYAVTTDGGKTWRAAVVPGAEALQFRDVEGVSDQIAYLMAAGVGTDSRIYKTTNGGATWSLQFENQDPNGFYDCFAFWTAQRGITMADSVDGRFPVIRTGNGKDWIDIGDRLPPAQAGEAAFAASGTCAATQGDRRAWLVTGGAERARVLATTDRGDSWASYDTPIIQGTPSSGGFSVAFRDRHHGILGGGELAAPAALSNNVARSRDGGRTWQLAAPTPFPGAIFGLSYAQGHGERDRGDDADDDRVGDAARRDDDRDGDRAAVVATGPGGAAWSADEGTSWSPLDGVLNYWAVAFANDRVGWLVGTDGRILKIEL